MNRTELLNVREAAAMTICELAMDQAGKAVPEKPFVVNAMFWSVIHKVACDELDRLSDRQPGETSGGNLVAALQHLTAWMEGRRAVPPIVVHAADLVSKAIVAEGGAS